VAVANANMTIGYKHNNTDRTYNNLVNKRSTVRDQNSTYLAETRDSNPGPVFSILRFGIGICNPGIPAGLWGLGGMISKTVIIKYMDLYC